MGLVMILAHSAKRFRLFFGVHWFSWTGSLRKPVEMLNLVMRFIDVVIIANFSKTCSLLSQVTFCGDFQCCRVALKTFTFRIRNVLSIVDMEVWGY